MNNLIVLQYHLNFSSLQSIMRHSRKVSKIDFLKSIGNRAKTWDDLPEATGNTVVAEWAVAEAGYRRDDAREGRKGANIKERARRGKGISWTTRERGSGLVKNRRRTPYSFGGSLSYSLTQGPFGISQTCPRTFRFQVSYYRYNYIFVWGQS